MTDCMNTLVVLIGSATFMLLLCSVAKKPLQQEDARLHVQIQKACQLCHVDLCISCLGKFGNRSEQWADTLRGLVSKQLTCPGEVIDSVNVACRRSQHSPGHRTLPWGLLCFSQLCLGLLRWQIAATASWRLASWQLLQLLGLQQHSSKRSARSSFL